MAVTIYLSDDVQLRVEISLEEMREAYQAALERNQPLEVTNGDGKKRDINPSAILYFEEAELDPEASGVQTSEPETAPS